MPGRLAVRRSLALLATTALLAAGAGPAATSAPAPGAHAAARRAAASDTVVVISVDALNPSALRRLGPRGHPTSPPWSTRARPPSTPAPSTS